ncbi:MAG: hypothetical protein WAW31_14820 [Smithella sp.]
MKTVYSSRFTVNGKSTIGALRHPSETLPTSRQRGTKRGKVLFDNNRKSRICLSGDMLS